MVLQESKILFLDASTVNTGWALFIKGKLVSSGAWNFKKFKTMGEQLQALEALLSTFDIDALYMENIFLGKNATTFKKLSKLQGIGELFSTKRGWEFNSELTAKMWRKEFDWAKLKGDEAKEKAIEYINKRYNKAVCNDEAEAICFGLALIGDVNGI